MMPPRLPTACLKALLVLVILAAGGGTDAAADFPAMTDATFRPAFLEYLADPAAAAAKHGPIEQWDVSGVTKMEQLFHNDYGTAFPGADTFNADISAWNTGNVVSMYRMFAKAPAFNKPIGRFNTAAVTNMAEMFSGAKAFNADISAWNTGNVVNMNRMFMNADAFNQPIGDWNTAAVEDMEFMFAWATSFDQLIGDWNTAAVTADLTLTFYYTGMSDCSKASIGHGSGFAGFGDKIEWAKIPQCGPTTTTTTTTPTTTTPTTTTPTTTTHTTVTVTTTTATTTTTPVPPFFAPNTGPLNTGQDSATCAFTSTEPAAWGENAHWATCRKNSLPCGLDTVHVPEGATVQISDIMATVQEFELTGTIELSDGPGIGFGDDSECKAGTGLEFTLPTVAHTTMTDTEVAVLSAALRDFVIGSSTTLTDAHIVSVRFRAAPDGEDGTVAAVAFSSSVDAAIATAIAATFDGPVRHLCQEQLGDVLPDNHPMQRRQVKCWTVLPRVINSRNID